MKRLLAVSAFVAFGLVALPALSQQRPAMTAHFMDVGQAHATLLEFPCGAMLIDAGTQDDEHETNLVDYLNAFFTRRTDLNRTFDSVLITHNHLDHTRSLRRVVEAFTVERYIDNGFTTGSGRGGPNWLRAEVNAGRRRMTVREEPGIELLVSHYGDAEGGPLDADVLQVGHHGSHNATTSELLDAVTPRVAVIPVGQWTFGRTGGNFTTFAFGHPREDVVDLLSQYTNRRRTPAKTVKVAERARRFRDMRVASAIYATGWDGTVRVVARAQNDITVYREH